MGEKMKVDNQLLSEVSNVMKLDFSDEELTTLVAETNDILEMMEMLSEVDTSEVQGTFHGVVNREVTLRKDEAVEKKDEVARILEKANVNEDNLIIVPAMLDNGEGGA